MHTVNWNAGIDKWEVGQWLRWSANGALDFDIIERFADKMKAYALCNYLNGGNGDVFSQPPETGKDETPMTKYKCPECKSTGGMC